MKPLVSMLKTYTCFDSAAESSTKTHRDQPMYLERATRFDEVLLQDIVKGRIKILGHIFN